MLVVSSNFHRYIVRGDNNVTGKGKFTGPRPIWFIYPGMGCQWVTMGRDLLKIDVFRNTFIRCAEALKVYGVDLLKLVTSDDPTILDNVLNSSASICAIQIALTDVLHSIGIHPVGIAGHSSGEVGKL